MGVLGKGQAHGACSLLHAAALGYGAAMALDLSVIVRLLDKPSKRDVLDDDAAGFMVTPPMVVPGGTPLPPPVVRQHAYQAGCRAVARQMEKWTNNL